MKNHGKTFESSQTCLSANDKMYSVWFISFLWVGCSRYSNLAMWLISWMLFKEYIYIF